MMSCAMLDSQLEDYLVGRLAPRDAERVEAHAGECERCAAILEDRSRLTVTLPHEVVPEPRHRDAVLARVSAQRKTRRRAQWFIPTAIAAGLLLAFSMIMPTTKSGQRRAPAGSPGALAVERADGEFHQLDAARAELRDAIAKAPNDPMLQRSLQRLDAQRRSLENLIREFES